MVTVAPRYVPAEDADVYRQRLRLRLRLRAAQQAHTTAPPDVLTWAETKAHILDPLTGVQPFRPYDYQTCLLQDIAPRRLILKARQTGISVTVALEALYRATYHAPWLGLFVSRNQDAAQQLIAYCQHALSVLRPAPRLERESMSELAFENGSRIQALPANPAAGRAFSASALYLDEFAWCAYAQQVYDGAVPTVAPGGQVTILSTPNGRSNLFFRLWEGLEGGEWSRHTIHWSHCPRYSEAWAHARRAEMTREAWAAEYECDFVASGGAVFSPADLARARQGWNGDPEGCSDYVTAWDLGRRQDWSVGLTFGRRGETWHEVAMYRGREDYPIVQDRIAARASLYGRPWVESNGIGDPIIQNLTVKAHEFQTTPRTKLQAIQALQLLLQHGRLRYGSPDLDRELALYQFDDQALIQDCVMAAAIAAAAIAGPQPTPVQVFF